MKMRQLFRKSIVLSLLTGAALFTTAAQGQQVLAINFGSDNDGDGGLALATAATEEGWSIETGSLRHTGDSASAWYNHIGSTTLPSVAGTDFEIELTFQWNQLGDGSAFRRIGVAFLGTASNDDLAAGDNYYYATFFPLQGDHGQLRLMDSVEGSTLTSNVSRTSGVGGAASSNVEFTLSLAGTYDDDGDLTVAFSVSDPNGDGGETVLSTTIAAGSAFSGSHFGIAGRARHNDTIDYGSFTAIPEPSTYAALAGLLALGLVIMRRRSVYRKK